jgi:hypothetical protein
MAITDSAEEVQTDLSSTDRIEVLKEKHATLENALIEESNRPMPDSSVVAHLKREKLAIKDEIQRLDTD